MICEAEGNSITKRKQEVSRSSLSPTSARSEFARMHFSLNSHILFYTIACHVYNITDMMVASLPFFNSIKLTFLRTCPSLKPHI